MRERTTLREFQSGKRKNVLVLATFDERGQGHGWYQAQVLEKEGYNVEFISLVRTNKDTKNYFIDLLNPYSLKTFFYNLVQFLSKILFFKYPKMRYWYKGQDWFASYKDILRRVSFKPDYIVIGQHVFFLSPKDIFMLWKKTGADITMIMVDPRIITGGCPYPNNCKKYENECIGCSMYPYLKCIPHKIWKKKAKYLSMTPFRIVGSSYDLKRLDKVRFLDDKIKIPTVSMPIINLKISKLEARKAFGLNDDDFVILFGAAHVTIPEKGFKELVASLKIFETSISKRNVKILALGETIPEMGLSDKIGIIKPGFLDFNGLFTAFYACDIFVSPSIEDSGPFMVNYAMACRRPVVAFEVGIAIDLVVTKETGWLAKLCDVDSMAAGLLYYYNMTPEELERINDNCLNRIQTFQEHPWNEFMYNE